MILMTLLSNSMDNGCFSSPRHEAFPAGLRVLVVDDDPTWLRILEKMLKKCLYEGWFVLLIISANYYVTLLFLHSATVVVALICCTKGL